MPYPGWGAIYNRHIVDRDGKIIETTVQKPVEPGLDTIVGRSVSDFLGPKLAGYYMKILCAVIRSGNTKIAEYAVGKNNYMCALIRTENDMVAAHEARVTPGSHDRVKRLLMNYYVNPVRAKARDKPCF